MRAIHPITRRKNKDIAFLRFDEIVEKLKQFLAKQAGFKDSDVTYVPVSGLVGENLVRPAKDPALTSWYKGPSLIEVRTLSEKVFSLDTRFESFCYSIAENPQ